MVFELRGFLVEVAGHRRPPVREIDRADFGEGVGILVQANDPQDRLATCLVGSAGELTVRRALLWVWPLALALDEVVLDPSTGEHEVHEFEDARLELLRAQPGGHSCSLLLRRGLRTFCTDDAVRRPAASAI